MKKTLKHWKLGLVFAAVAGLGVAARPQQPPASQAPAPQQPSEIATRITSEPNVAARYAVPDFVALTPAAADTAKMLGQVLWDDLNFERAFYMIGRDTYGTIPIPRTPDQMPFDRWRELGADAVFWGTVEQKGDDVLVRVRLFNVRSRQSVFAKEYTTRARSARNIAHTISDEVLFEQTGIRGVARTRLAFQSDRNNESILGTVEKRSVKEIYISDYDGANQTRITTTRELNGYASWSADAQAIAYMAWRNNLPPDIIVSFIYTGLRKNITEGISNGAYTPAFSPDGKQILFAAMAENASATDIWVANADGTNPRRLTTHPAADITPTWSPAGTQIAFTSDRTGRERIYLINADGSNLRLLDIPDNRADRATWAPFPYNEIAYSAWTGSGWDIKVYELNTRTTRQLTFGEGSNESPAYSPSGRHIAFSSTRRGNVQIFTIGRDGNGLRQVTRTGNNEAPDWSN